MLLSRTLFFEGPRGIHGNAEDNRTVLVLQLCVVPEVSLPSCSRYKNNQNSLKHSEIKVCNCSDFAIFVCAFEAENGKNREVSMQPAGTRPVPFHVRWETSFFLHGFFTGYKSNQNSLWLQVSVIETLGDIW